MPLKKLLIYKTTSLINTKGLTKIKPFFGINAYFCFMGKHLFYLFLFFSTVSFGQKEAIQATFISKTALTADVFIGLDDLDNIYYLKNNVLFKKNEQVILNYSNPLLGELSSVNIQNPFKIVLFYKNFNSVIILDNKLNALSNVIDFTKETLFNNVQFVSLSSENNLWLFADDNKLHLYNYQTLSQSFQTQAITFYNATFKPNSLKSTYKNVWVLSKNSAVQFNEYGSFIESFHFKDASIIFPYQKGFIYIADSSFYYQFENEIIPILMEIKKPLTHIFVHKSSIYTFDGKYIYQYDLFIK